MLARSQTLNHPSGRGIQTPLLLPSFSSRGFAMVEHEDGTWISELSRDLRLASEDLYSGLLVSAYDLFHGHLLDADEYLGIPEVLFVDSGGYELGLEDDLSSLYSHAYAPKSWSLEDFASVLDRVASTCLNDVAIVSPDLEGRGRPIEEQINSARELFEEWPAFLHDLLLKPTTKDQKYLPVDQIRGAARQLRGFAIIGVTEIELGNSLLDRLRSLARIRLALDEAGVSSPIHVFGSLDPLLTPLYFLAGAEVFDGLSWLRYGYHNGVAIYYQHFSALVPGIQRRRDQVRTQMLIHNLNELDRLRINLLTFLEGGDFGVFGPRGDQLREWYNHLCGQVSGVR